MTAIDIISDLAGIAPGSALAALREQRAEATLHAQGSYNALFDPTTRVGLRPLERFAIALRVASIHDSPEASDHYRTRLLSAGADGALVNAAGRTSGSTAGLSARLAAIMTHVDLVSTHPIDGTPDDLQKLADAGLATVEILQLSQIVAYTSFQVRVIRTLQLLGAGSGNVTAAQPVVEIPAASLPPATIIRPPAGSLNSPTVFTRQQLAWTPWLVGLDPADASPAQLAALEKRKMNLPYFRLLALDVDVLEERTATDLGIFYTHGGAPRAERELAAGATSRLNGCIYCASQHARIAAQLSKREADVDRLLDQGITDLPALQLGERWEAEVDFAVELSRTPAAATAVQIERLHEAGLSDLEILDIGQAASFFSWANRLMLTLGEPYFPAATA
jgi:alkylhydroperoxidase domain protein/CMD domain protein